MSVNPAVRADGPVLLFGGPYSNLQATRAVLAEAHRRAIPPGRIVCTGDVVAYCADAAATLDLVRGSGIHVVMGNCEEALAAGAPDCGCGFAPDSDCDRLSAAWYAHAASALDEDARAWMAGLPRRLDVVIAGLRLAVIHGGLDEIARFVLASTPDEEKRRDLERAEADGIVGGHCGLPFTRIVGGRLWHNPGVVGMPANDGTARVWFSIVAPEGGPHSRRLRIEHRSMDYPHREAAAAMRMAGLPAGYAEALCSGLWPSCDVLPAEERAATGVALAESSLVWAPTTQTRREHGHSAPGHPISAA